MKKLIKFFTAAVCGFALSSAFALDYGFLVDNNTSFRTRPNKEMYFFQQDSASAWIKVPFGSSPDNYFVGEGLYKFEFNGNTNQLYHYLDLNLLKFVFINELESGKLEADLGRFFVVDATGLIFTQNCDGAFVKYSNDFMEVSGYAGYTGLLNGNTVTMINSPSFKGNDAKQLYDFADRNVIAMVTGNFPFLFADQSVKVQFAGAFRTDEITYNRMYATLGMNGPIAGNLFYNIAGTAAFISYNGKPVQVAPFVKADLVYYFPIASVGLNAVFAGNDFTGITSQTALDSSYEPEYKGLLKTGISAKVRPINNLLISVSGDVAFDGSKNFELKGAQYKVGADYQVVSDVLIGASWVQYFDINKTDLDYQAVSIKAKIAF